MKRLDGLILEGKYQLKEPIGKGGMGAVYLAKDLKLNTYWAVKVIDTTIGGDVDLLAEPNMLKSLQHPALPRITDITETGNYIFIVMDFIDGRNLESVAQENGKIEEETVVIWAKEICDVLQYLHNQKPNPIIYRDMKPSNIMITKDERIKLIDFGTAREFKEEASGDTEYLGTRGYAAPEQYKNSQLQSQTDGRTDIYGLGVTMYRLITGKRPDEPPYELKALREIDNTLTEGIEYIVKKCTELDPDLRYESIAELKKDLDNVKKLGNNFEKEKKMRKVKLYTSAIGMGLSTLLTINGWLGYSSKIELKYNEFIAKGIEYRNQLDFDSAIKEFQAAQEYVGRKKESNYEIVKTYMAQWSLDEGLRYLNQTAGNKNDDYGNYLFGKLYFLKSNYDEASNYFNKVAKVENVEKDFEELKIISNELKDIENINSENIIAALNRFEKFIDSNNSDKVMALNLYLATSDIYFQVATIIPSSEDSQIKVLEKAEKIDGNNYVVLDRLASAHMIKANSIRQSDIETYNKYLNLALEIYYKCLDIQPSLDVYKNIGDIYLSLNNVGEAENNYKKMVELNSQNYLGYLKLARLYFSKGEIEKSKKYIKQAESCENLRTNDPQYNSLKNSLR